MTHLLFKRPQGVLCVALACASLSAHAEPLPRWELGLGVAGVSMPDYRGSDQDRRYLLPFPMFVYRIDWLKADRSGVRAKLFDADQVELNFSMSASPPVRSKHNEAREGMADIKPMVEFGPSLDLGLWHDPASRSKLTLRLPVRAAYTVQNTPRSAGLVFQPRLNLDVGHVLGNLDLGLLAGPLFANRRQNAYFYSVAERDVREGRPAYAAHGGYAGTQFLASLSHKNDSNTRWAGAYVRYDTLRGATFIDSPLVRRNHYLSFGFAVTWALARSTDTVESQD